MPIEGSVAEEVCGVGGTVAGAVLGTSAQGVAGSHSVAPVLEMVEQWLAFNASVRWAGEQMGC